MSRITKSIAESVAIQLTEKKKAEFISLENDLKLLNTEIHISKIPQAVMDFFEIYPEYVDSKTGVYFSGNGLNNYHNVRFSRELPTNSQFTKIEPKEAQKIIKLEDKISDKKKEYRELVEQIEIALINLRTYNNVEKEFPEAFKLLPVSKVNTQLAVNVKSIRCKLDKSTC